MDDEISRERIECLVQQGFTPSLARKVVLARSREYLPLTVWIVDNSGSMIRKDGRKIVETKSQEDVRFERCTRWEELQETVKYHAQLAALLEAPTKFLMLNGPHYMDPNHNNDIAFPQDLSIAERGSEWIDDDMEHFFDEFSRIRPRGATPLTRHLRLIHQSVNHMKDKIVLVVATDGKPTDDLGFTSPAVDRAFENALRQMQSKAWIVIRLCTNDEAVLKYYQKLDDHMELSLEVLDDYTDEAKEVYRYNPWLTYSLGLHRCREMGMSCHPMFRFLDWLDERPLARNEIGVILRGFGMVGTDCDDSIIQLSSQSEEDWNNFCEMLRREQDTLTIQHKKKDGTDLKAFFPWNPIRKKTTHWVDIEKLKQHGRRKIWLDTMLRIFPIVFVVLVAVYIKTLY